MTRVFVCYLAMSRLNTGNPTSSSHRRYITDGEAKPETSPTTKETELSANPEENEYPREDVTKNSKLDAEVPVIEETFHGFEDIYFKD